MEQNNTLDLLLKMDVPDAPKKELKQKRLSKECKADVIFTIQGLSYRVAEIRESHSGEDMAVFTVLAGVKSPDLKSLELRGKYGADTPAELIKRMFLPGEIEDLSREIEKLSGYRIDTLEEIKKK